MTRDRIRTAICAAMKHRRVIEFDYHGGCRTAEPFCLGMVKSGAADNESLLCFQTGGHSEFGEPVGWKLYRASEIENLEIIGEQFRGERPGYNPHNPEMATVYCCVDASADEKDRVAEAGEPVGNLVGERPICERPARTASASRTHNETMRRFRFTHPVPLPDLYTNILA